MLGRRLDDLEIIDMSRAEFDRRLAVGGVVLVKADDPQGRYRIVRVRVVDAPEKPSRTQDGY